MDEIDIIMTSLSKYLGKNNGHFSSIYQHYIDTDIFHRHDNCPWFVNHDIDHINGVLKNLSLILERFKSVSEIILTDDEIYFLLCAAVFHDIGMLFNIDNKKVKEGSNRCKTAREKHGCYSCVMIKEYLKNKIEMDNGVNIVCEIMKYHQSKAPLNEEYKNLLRHNNKTPLYGVMQKTMSYSKIITVKTELLAALLQLADAFDVSSRRAKFTEKEWKENFINTEARNKIDEAINHFTNGVKNEDKEMLDVLNGEKININKLESSLVIVREYTDYLNSNSKSESMRCLEEAINIIEQPDHIQKHQAIHDIYFKDETIYIKTVNNHKEIYSNKVKNDIILEVRLTDLTFLKYLPNMTKLFSFIRILNENDELISRKTPIFSEDIGKLESDLKNCNQNAWNDFKMFKQMCKTHRKSCGFCEDLDHCEDMYENHCEDIEEQVKNIIDTCEIYLPIDELLTILNAIWGHELCNRDILDKSNFSDCKLKLDKYATKRFTPKAKGLINRALFLAQVHTDYIFSNEFKTYYKDLNVEDESHVYGGNGKTFIFDMPRLFWLLRYCELISKSESFCRLDFPHWSLVALKRCWPIDFINRDFCKPGSIVKILPDQNKMSWKTWHNCIFTDINKFLYTVILYELNKMCDEDMKTSYIHNQCLINGIQTFDDLAGIDNKYIQMCKDFASENNQLEKIFCYDDVNISELYLFRWGNTKKNDDIRLIGFLKDKFKIEGVNKEDISKTEDGKTIIVSNIEKSISLKLNDDETKVNLTIDDVRVDEFTVKTENGELNIYSKFNKEQIENTLLEVNGDYLCDIFMKSYINVSNSDSTHKPDDSTRNFLHSDKCVCTGLELNGIHDTSYLFSWNNDAENDYMKLIEFLKNKFNIEWVQTENIRKKNGDKTIKVSSNNEKSISLELNDDETKVNLTIDDGKVDEFIVKTENGTMNIHDTSIQINDIIYELFENCEDKENNLYKTLYLYLAVYCNNEYDIDWVYKTVTKKTVTEKKEGGINIFDKGALYSLGD